MFDKKGKLVLVCSYSILQDEFYEHMQKAEFKDFLCGERGSTAEYKNGLQYQVEKDKQRLAAVEEQVASANAGLQQMLPVQAAVQGTDSIERKILTGKVQISSDDYLTLSNLAKECLANRTNL